MSTQASLRLSVAADVRLVTVETARACLGVDAPTVADMIDGGELVAFDVSPRREAIRETRVWVGTLEGAKVELPKADSERERAMLDHIVGTASEITAAQLAQRISVDDNTVHRLANAGLIQSSLRRDGSARRMWVDTQSLRSFLQSRLLGGI